MFITRATRHDRTDIAEFLQAHGWSADEVARGTTFFARDGRIVGCVRLVEVEPRTVVVDDLLVDRSRRREGVGTSLMQAAMNSRGGTLYLSCHGDGAGFYDRLGFVQVGIEELPESVRAYLEEAGNHSPPSGHQQLFLKAR